MPLPNSPLGLFLLAVLGLILGSFLSVLIYRLHTGKGGIWMGSSMCPHCNKRLTPKELIPLVSYLIQDGSCTKCKKKIAWHYPALELSTALLFLAAGLYGFQPLGFTLIYIVLLGFIFFYDLLYMEVPDEVLVPAIGFALLASIHPSAPTVMEAVLGGLILVAFFLAQILISKGRWLGGGDLRIGAFIGLILGWKLMLVAVMAAYLLGAIISTVLLATGRATRKTMIAFGPFLVMGTLIALFYGNSLKDAYLNFIGL